MNEHGPASNTRTRLLRRPRWLAPLLLSVTLMPVAAEAAPAKPAKPVCRLIVDPANDEEAWASSLGYYDIVSADLATDSRVKTLSATVRVRSLDLLLANGTNDTQVYWIVRFQAPKVKYPIEIQTHLWTTFRGVGPGIQEMSTTSELIAVGGTKNNGFVAVGEAEWDVAADELRMRVPLAEFAAYTGTTLRPKQQFTSLSARSQVLLMPTVDSAASTARYTVGAPSCIKPEAPFQ